jgi:hypothetical protein
MVSGGHRRAAFEGTMTTNRNLKARIRARMEQTGESYATARAHVLREGPNVAGGPILALEDEQEGGEITIELEDGRRITGHAFAVNALRDAMKLQRERNARWPQTPRGDVDTRAAMTTLARLFPTLRGADGIEPWNIDRFARWLCGPVPGGGAACQFAGSWGHPFAGSWGQETEQTTDPERAANRSQSPPLEIILPNMAGRELFAGSWGHRRAAATKTAARWGVGQRRRRARARG